MKKFISLFFLIGSVSISVFAQTDLKWHFQNSGSSNGAIYGMNNFSNGDICVTGFNWDGDIDPGVNVNSPWLHFVARYDTSGQLIFGRPITYDSTEVGGCSEPFIDKDGNIFIYFSPSDGSFDFDTLPGIGELTLNHPGNVIVKFDSTGKYLWNIAYEHVGISAYNLVILNDGSLLICGRASNGVYDLDPDTGVYLFDAQQTTMGFIVKFDTSGHFVTAAEFRTTNGRCEIGGIISDKSGNIYACGKIEGVVDVDPGPMIYNLNGSLVQTHYDYGFIKLDSNLNFVYAYLFTSNIFYGMLPVENNNIVIYGRTEDSTDIDPTAGVKLAQAYDSYILKLDSSGNFIWGKTVTPKDKDEFEFWIVDYLDDGTIYATIEIGDTIMKNELGLPDNIYAGTWDVYLIKLNEAGELIKREKIADLLQNARPLIKFTTPDKFYFSGRIYESTDIQIGPLITIASPVNTKPWNEFFLSYYSIDTLRNNRIAGNAYIDYNNDSIQQLSEPPIPNQIFKILPGPDFVSTDEFGFFEDYVDSGSFIVSSPNPPLNFNPSYPAAYTVNFAGHNLADTSNNFAFYPFEFTNDLFIDATAAGNARPGFDVVITLTYKNLATNIMNGYVEFIYDSILSYVSSSKSPAYIGGDTIRWSFTNLNPFFSKKINVLFHVDSAAQIGTNLFNRAFVKPINGDNTSWNNIDTLEMTLTGSLDPNNKLVFPDRDFDVSEIQNAVKLTYTINFQNTGNDTAFNVTILDTLDKDLAIQSFKIISSSHPCKFQLYGGNLAEFRFQNIKLPDSISNEPYSHGFIKYSIYAKKTLAAGSEISNNAYIYFDYNQPVVTNSTSNYVINLLSIDGSISKNLISIFPNPVTDFLQIQSNEFIEKAKIEITDVTGKVVYTDMTSLNNHDVLKINLKKYARGIYFLKVATEKNDFREKILKW